MDTIQFLKTIYENAETGYTEIFTLPSAIGTACAVEDLDKAASIIPNIPPGQNIYFSPGITEQPINSKPSNPDIIAIPALWVDIDIYDPNAHAKKNLPKSVDEARTLLPLQPSLIVHSGYGIHAWWILRECWYFDTPEEKKQAEQLINRLHECVKKRASDSGWHLDATFDLSRVMRLPGTVNYKNPQQPIMASVIEQSDIRYNPSDFDSVLPAIEQTAATTERRTAAFERRETDGPAEYMLTNCMFMQHCQLNAKSVSYDEWLAMITNVVRATDGIKAVHKISALDPDRYNPGDTDKKIDEALGAMNPQNCEYIRSKLGFIACPEGGCGMQAPCGWSLGRVPQAKAKIKAIAVPTPETVYQPDIIGALAILQKQAPADYDIFYQRCKGQLNLNTLRHELAQQKRDNAGLTVIDGGGRSAAVESDANGDKWLAQAVPDIPLNLRLPGSGSNYSVWEFDTGGVRIKKQSIDGNIQVQSAAYNPVIISERIKNIDTKTEKAKISFKNDSGKWQNVLLPKSTIYNAKNIINLTDSGLNFTSVTSQNLVRWLSSLEAANRNIIPIKEAVSKMGWRNNDTEFIIPGIQTKYAIDIGDDAAESAISGLGQSGDFAQWIEMMRQLRIRIKARFIMAASFAAPLLKIVGQRSFLIHNWDNTQGGKSATLFAALSVWGNPNGIAKTFSDTKTNMERVAALFTDLPMGINEDGLLTERQKNDIDSMIYMIAEEKGRGRANKDGLLKTVSWRTVALMTGEEQITRANSRGGIFTRLIEVKGGPLVGDDIFASNLYSFTAKNHGYAGKLFVENLLKTDHNWLRESYIKTRMALREKYPSKIQTHLDALACVALADYLASMWIWGTQEQLAGSESIAMVESIIAELATKTDADEAARAWEWLPDWLAANESKFQTGYNIHKMTATWLGYIDENGYSIIKNELEKALKAEGFNSNKVLNAWTDENKIPCTYEKSGRRKLGIRYRANIGEARRPYVIQIGRNT